MGEGGPATRCGLDHGLHHARAFEVLVSKAAWWMSVLAEHRPAGELRERMTSMMPPHRTLLVSVLAVAPGGHVAGSRGWDALARSLQSRLQAGRVPNHLGDHTRRGRGATRPTVALAPPLPPSTARAAALRLRRFAVPPLASSPRPTTGPQPGRRLFLPSSCTAMHWMAPGANMVPLPPLRSPPRPQSTRWTSPRAPRGLARLKVLLDD